MKTNMFKALLLLGLSSSSFYAQEFKRTDLFDVGKITEITQLDIVQKTIIDNAIINRNKALKDTVQVVDKKTINKTYCNVLLEVLSDVQEEEVFKPLINVSTLNKRTSKDLNKLRLFPEAYKINLTKKLKGYIYELSLNDAKYYYDHDARALHAIAIKEAKFEFLKEENLKLKDAKYLARRIKSAHPSLTDTQVSLYRDYHFYVGLQEKDKYAAELLKTTQNESFTVMLDVISNGDVNKILKSNTLVKNLEEDVKNAISNKLKPLIIANYQKNVTADTAFDISLYDVNINKEIKEVLAEQKEVSKQKAVESAALAFKEKAKKAGLSEDKTDELVALINKRNQELADYKRNRNNQNDVFLIVEEELKTPKDIKKEFSIAIAKILSVKEYGILLGDQFKNKVLAQTKADFSGILENNELTDEQSEKVYQQIFIYHYKRANTTAYYSYDKQLRKQKLGVLRYRFEKKYKALCKSYHIKTGGTKKIDNRTFQWN